MEKLSLLIVEDNVVLNNAIRSYLRKYFTIHQTPTFNGALSLLDKLTQLDVVILDRFLPDGDGLELLPILNRYYPQTRICVLSNGQCLTDKLRGLDSGADVYLPKPIGLPEIKSQIIALLRRTRLLDHQLIKQGNIALNLHTRKISNNDETVTLTKRQTEIMTYFLQNPFGFVSKDQLFDVFWRLNSEPSDSAIHVNIQRLRKKLMLIGINLISKYGSGYQLALAESSSA